MKKTINFVGVISLVFLMALAISVMTSCTRGEKEGPAEMISSGGEVALSKLELLGKKIFFDDNLSTPPGQACASCHDPGVGWSGPTEEFNRSGAVYEGALAGRFGNRKPPTAAYAGFNPVLHRNEDGDFVGGMFWDGRATGWEIGDPLAEQAMGPFLNPLEHNNPDKKSVVLKVMESDYVDLFKEVWGNEALSVENEEAIEKSFELIARSVAAFERSREVNPFNSKFDYFWRRAKEAGRDVTQINEKNWREYLGLGLTEEEVEGLMIFVDKALCVNCHVLDEGPHGEPPVFTDFTYDNLGVPRNPENPFYQQPAEFNPDGANWIDKGLVGFLETTEKYAQYAQENYGKHKVPTLRNVDLRPSPGFVKAYLHNGFFKTLKEVVHFYNTRDVKEWPPPEVSENINRDEMGDLGLGDREEDLLVLFMKTLSDGFQLEKNIREPKSSEK